MNFMKHADWMNFIEASPADLNLATILSWTYCIYPMRGKCEQKWRVQYVHDNFIARKGSAGDVSMKFIQSACYKNSSNRCAGNSRQQVSPRSWFIHGSVIVHSWLGPISARSRDECSYVTQCLFFIDESFILFLPRFYIMWLKSLRKHRVVLRYFYLHNIFIQWEKSII